MIGTRRTTLLMLLVSTGIIAGTALVLVFSVPAVKQVVKERWHRWNCPDIPKEHSERSISAEGLVQYTDPFPFCISTTGNPTSLFYDFECPLSTWFTATDSAFSGVGVMSGQWLSSAVQRRIGDVADGPVSISCGFMFKSSVPEPQLRAVIRIDRADGALLQWNEKRLLAREHRTDTWQRFNFEWILRDLPTGPDDLVTVFIRSDDEKIHIDDMTIVFRSPSPLRPSVPHA